MIPVKWQKKSLLILGILILAFSAYKVDPVMFLFGALLIKFRSRILRRDFLFLLVTFAFCFLLLEVAFRISYTFDPPNSRMEKKLGWETGENIHKKRSVKGYGEITFTTSKYGFRRFGDTTTKKTKLFVIGDSFSEANGVSDGETYYDYLAENNDTIEIFAYGCSGYGSLQEYLILKEYFDDIKPDIILWQFCSNDFFENLYDLDRIDDPSHHHYVRPFLINGRIEYKGKETHPSLVILSSHVLRTIKFRFNILKMMLFDTGLVDFSLDHSPLFEDTVHATLEIMKLVRNIDDNVILAAFSVDEALSEKTEDVFSTICRKTGIHYIPGIPRAIERAEDSGMKVTLSKDDNHWNAAGHSIAGEKILKYLEKNVLNPLPDDGPDSLTTGSF